MAAAPAHLPVRSRLAIQDRKPWLDEGLEDTDSGPEAVTVIQRQAEHSERGLVTPLT